MKNCNKNIRNCSKILKFNNSIMCKCNPQNSVELICFYSLWCENKKPSKNRTKNLFKRKILQNILFCLRDSLWTFFVSHCWTFSDIAINHIQKKKKSRWILDKLVKFLARLNFYIFWLNWNLNMEFKDFVDLMGLKRKIYINISSFYCNFQSYYYWSLSIKVLAVFLMFFLLYF